MCEKPRSLDSSACGSERREILNLMMTPIISHELHVQHILGKERLNLTILLLKEWGSNPQTLCFWSASQQCHVKVPKGLDKWARNLLKAGHMTPDIYISWGKSREAFYPRRPSEALACVPVLQASTPPASGAPADFTQKWGGRSLRPSQPPWQTCWIFNDVSVVLRLIRPYIPRLMVPAIYETWDFWTLPVCSCGLVWLQMFIWSPKRMNVLCVWKGQNPELYKGWARRMPKYKTTFRVWNSTKFHAKRSLVSLESKTGSFSPETVNMQEGCFILSREYFSSFRLASLLAGGTGHTKQFCMWSIFRWRPS